LAGDEDGSRHRGLGDRVERLSIDERQIRVQNHPRRTIESCSGRTTASRESSAGIRPGFSANSRRPTLDLGHSRYDHHAKMCTPGGRDRHCGKLSDKSSTLVGIEHET
jgi:hypothetical protein